MTATDEAHRKFAVFEKRRNKLVKAYEKAETPKAQLIALAKLTRQHGEWMEGNMLVRGWLSETVIGISERMEEIAARIESVQ